MRRVTELGYWMDDILCLPIANMVYNIDRKWDFMILITGSGMKRIGKSMLATQVGKYASYLLKTPFDITNICFGGKELAKAIQSHCHRSVLIDDESKTDFSSKRVMESFNKALSDYLSTIGKFNDLLILVAPDFFQFSKSTATTDSELLINCDRKVELTNKEIDGNRVSELTRGYMDLYDRRGKRELYKWAKKTGQDEYNKRFRYAYGTFREFWTVDEAEYERRKDIFIQENELLGARAKNQEERMSVAVMNMIKEGIPQKKIAQYFDVTEAYISKIKEKNLRLTLNTPHIVTPPPLVKINGID